MVDYKLECMTIAPSPNSNISVLATAFALSDQRRRCMMTA